MGEYIPPFAVPLSDYILQKAGEKIGAPYLPDRCAQLTVPHNGHPACHYCGNCVTRMRHWFLFFSNVVHHPGGGEHQKSNAIEQTRWYATYWWTKRTWPKASHMWTAKPKGSGGSRQGRSAGGVLPGDRTYYVEFHVLVIGPPASLIPAVNLGEICATTFMSSRLRRLAPTRGSIPRLLITSQIPRLLGCRAGRTLKTRGKRSLSVDILVYMSGRLSGFPGLLSKLQWLWSRI